MNGNSVSPFAAAVILLGAAAAGVLGVVLWNATQDEGMVIAGAPGTVLADPTPAPAQFGPTVAPGLPQPTPVPPPGQAPAETAVPDAPTSPIQFDDALIADAIAQGGANPLVGLPTRNVVATELLIAQFTSAGIDLTGIEFIVYPESAVPSFVLMTTSDSTPLLGLDGGTDDAASETFLQELFESPVLDRFAIEKLIMQHTGVDDIGPFEMTLTVRLDDLRAATEGVDVFDRVAVQVERP